MTDLGTANGAPCSNAFSINSERQVVGDSTNCLGVALNAFIWENGSIADLNTLIPPGSGLQLITALYINDRGKIAGNGLLTNGDVHAYLLIPCDEKHPGECQDYSMIEAAAPQTSAPTVEFPERMKQGSESHESPVNQLRSRLMKRYHILGYPAVYP